MTTPEHEKVVRMAAETAVRPSTCLVCGSVLVQSFMVVDAKAYWRCAHCLATFLDPAERLAPGEERALYELHENDPADSGYRGYLARLGDVLTPCLQAGAEGLDYGCGPGPALVRMLSEQGFVMSAYDPFFAPDPAVLARDYDFVTCTEVAEHWHTPHAELRRIARLVRPGGWLGVMTTFQTEDSRFARWQYRRDPTHVVFYRAHTWHVIAGQLGWTCEIPRPNVAMLQKPR